MKLYVEDYQFNVKEDCYRSRKNIVLEGSASVDLSASTGTFKFPSGGIASAIVITSAAAAAFAVGANGNTNPVIRIDASIANAATGVSVTGAAAGAGVTIQVISSGTNEDLLVKGKGTGSLKWFGDNAFFGVGNSGTGTMMKLGSLGDANNVWIDANGSGTNVGIKFRTKGSGLINFQPTTANSAGGAADLSVRIGSGLMGIFVGSGAPTVSAPKGSLYLRDDGSSTSTRAYINTDGATAWTAITTAA